MRRLGALASLWFVLVLMIGCVPRPSALPVLWDAPQFNLVDASGQPFATTDLAGKVWLIDFIYTNCPDVCPVYLSPKMKTLQDEVLAKNLVGQVELVSLTVDPRRDTPAVLAEYGARFGADPRVWRFLTGPDATIQPLLQTGFKIGSAIKAEEAVTVSAGQDTQAHGQGAASGTPAGSYTLIHSSYFLLVDGAGKIRANYDGTEVEAAKMFGDMRQLLAQK
jgi:protein SCO1